jgi:hypothetical protein
MLSSKRAIVLGMAALAALGTLKESNADTNAILVQTGVSTAPGAGGGTVSSLSDFPAINSSGQVAVVAGLSSSNDGASYSLMRIEGTSALTAIARSGQAAPGSGAGIMSALSNATINSSGQVMAFANLSGTTDSSFQGFFRGDGSAPLAALMRQKAAAPGAGGGIIEGAYGWSFGDTGAVTAEMSLSGTPASQGIFQADGNGITQAARQFLTAPGAGAGVFSNLNVPTNNSLGQVAFFANLNNTNNGSNQGVFRYTPSAGLIEIARNGQNAAGGGTLSGFINFQLINNAGQVAFGSGINGAPDGANTGIFRGNGTTTVAIARHNQAAPGGGVFGGTIGQNDLLINNAGQVLFQSPIVSAPDGSLFGIFRGDGSNLTAIARTGQAMPGGATLNSTGAEMALTSGGAALYTGFLGNLPPGSTEDRGMYLSDGRDTIQVVRRGQALDSSTVNSFSYNQYTYAGGFNAVNDAGQVAYIANLADGSSAIVKFTPTIHWRESFGGNWDNGNNWTLGINPSAVHDVLIDPQSGANVSGPAGTVSIASLLVAGKAGSAFLDLNGGGQLVVNGPTTIKSTGSVNVSSGKLSGGAITNDGFLSVSVGGQLAVSALSNNNNVNLSGPTTIGGTIINNGSMNVSHTSLGGGQLINNVQLFLDAATVSNAIVNEVGASMTARGTINNLITNRGTLTANGLLTIGALTNSGVTNINAGSSIAQGTITNTGLITLAGGGLTAPVTNNGGGILQGGGGITSSVTNNTGGLILANNPLYPLTINTLTTNQPAARIRVADGSTLSVGNTITNSGVITLLGDEANLNVGSNQTISNSPTGIISGAGTITANVSNSGTVRAEGGELMITGGATTNQSSGLMQVSEGATLLFAQGMSNSGTINVTGGSWINNTGTSFSNNGKVSGYGTFTSPTIINNGTMTFTGGFTTINGTINNGSSRKIEVANNPALFTGNVSNSGISKTQKPASLSAGATPRTARLSPIRLTIFSATFPWAKAAHGLAAWVTDSSSAGIC